MKTLGICLLFLGLVACGQKAGNGGAKPGAEGAGKGKDRKPAVAAYVVRPVSMQQSVLGVGTLLAAEQVDIKTEVTGRVASIDFREGQAVAAGARLVKLYDEELQANRAKAVAKRDYLQGALGRKEKQRELEALSQQELELAQSELAAAEADVRLLDAQLAKTEIRAPFAGELGLRLVSPGAVLSAGQSITTLIKRLPARVEFSVQSDRISLVPVGARVLVALGPDRVVEARVVATAGLVDATSRNLRVRALLNEVGGLPPGSAVEVRIPTEAQTGFRVPPDALSGDAQGPVVYVSRGLKARAVPVQVGQRTADLVQILSGLQAGDTVLCAGAQMLRNGMAVNVSEMRE